VPTKEKAGERIPRCDQVPVLLTRVVVRVTAAERLGYHRLVCQVPAATLSHATGLWVAYRSERQHAADATGSRLPRSDSGHPA